MPEPQTKPFTIRISGSRVFRLFRKRRKKKTGQSAGSRPLDPPLSAHRRGDTNNYSVTATLQKFAENAAKISISLTLDTVNGLEHQALVAAQGGKITIDNIKAIAPYILKACQAVEETSERFGVPIHHDVGMAIKVVRAAAQVINQIPDLPDVHIPPLKDNLQEVLDGIMREGSSGNKDVKAQPKPKSTKVSVTLEKLKLGSGTQDQKKWEGTNRRWWVK